MRDVELVRSERVTETVHLDEQVEVDRQWLRFPEGEAGPALSVVRTHLPGGATRPPVLLVHGFAQNRYTWRISRRSLVGRLAAEGFDVLNVELRGHGLSRRYGSGNATSFDEYVHDAVRVARACELPPFAVGHSLGGGVIVGASTQVELAGLVHLAGVYSFARHNRTLRALARVGLKLEPMLRAAPMRVHTRWIGDVLGRAYQLTDIAGYGLPLAGWVPGSIERDLLEERLTDGFDWVSVEVMLQMCRWARGEPFAYGEAFAALDVPLLVVAGDADPLLPPGDAQVCYDASRSGDRELLVLDAFEHEVHWGHVDLILGRRAPDIVWPRLVSWMTARSG